MAGLVKSGGCMRVPWQRDKKGLLDCICKWLIYNIKIVHRGDYELLKNI